MQTMASQILLLALLLALFNGWMYMQQPSMIFFPQKALDETPAAWGLEYEEVSLNTADNVRLHGWYLPNPGSGKALLFFHGNAGNISHRGSSVEIFHRLGVNVLIFDYRGFGASEGRPDESGLYEDARAAWRFLREEKGFDSKDIILFGRSLGGTVATKLASEVHPAGLILESSFSSARDMASEIMPLISRVVFLRFSFNTLDIIDRIHCPLLVLHSPGDEVIPFGQGEKIFRAAREPKTFVTLEGGHNGGYLLSQPGYEQALEAFIRRVSGSPGPR
jgi:hypothetical protein